MILLFKDPVLFRGSRCVVTQYYAGVAYESRCADGELPASVGLLGLREGGAVLASEASMRSLRASSNRKRSCCRRTADGAPCADSRL